MSDVEVCKKVFGKEDGCKVWESKNKLEPSEQAVEHTRVDRNPYNHSCL